MTYKSIESGSGRPLIMLHGIFGHASNWRDTVDKLSDEYRAIALELPYLELANKDLGVGNLTNYVLNFADSTGLDKAVYIGNSLGGHIALDIAIKARDRIDALVLTGSSGLFEKGYEEDLQIHPKKPYVRKKVGELFFDQALVTDELVDSVFNALSDKKNRLKAIRLFKAAKSYNVKSLLGLIDCKTLLVWGRQDLITPEDVALEFNKMIKGSTLEFIEDCCHAPMMEHPERFVNLVSGFLSEL
ncbi:MAG: alpha/beta fold hydrolase [Candidatus Omnitrophota bacterium]